MISSARKAANAVRACDSCIRKRARWHCAAADAFLCQSCDSSVHSASPLAQRHDTVRLETAGSIKCSDDHSRLQIFVPAWHQGFTRKARTPRQKKHASKLSPDGSVSGLSNTLHLVPEIEHSNDENEEQLLCRVPIFEPFVAELCNSSNSNEAANDVNQGFRQESKHLANDFSEEMNHLEVFLPSEMDLAEFAADVESLLGKGLEDESLDMEGLCILGETSDEKEKQSCPLGRKRVKVEDIEEVGEVGNHHPVGGEFTDLGRETFELNDSPITTKSFEDSKKVFDSKKIFLRLDYAGVMSAWDGRKSPWTNGERPDFDSDGCWPGCLGTCSTMHVCGYMGMMSEREARVSRYREKRRTRLFSKTIRYQVRKLNAEKRPRMKGRFVKRAD